MTPEEEHRKRMADAIRRALIESGALRPGCGEWMSPAPNVRIALPLDERGHARAARTIHETNRERAVWLRDHGAEPLRAHLWKMHERKVPSRSRHSAPLQNFDATQ